MVAFSLALGAASSAAQPAQASTTSSIAVRKLGATIRTSAVTFGQVQHLRRLSDGRVLVNDPGRHQVLLLDSTLANPVVVIDSVGGHDNSYGTRAGGLLPYRGDSTLFADPVSSSLLLIDPAGKIARVMSVRINTISYLTSPTAWGYPAYSDKFGLVFRMSGSSMPWPTQMPPEGAPEVIKRGEDSAIVVAMNVATRKVDTLAKLSVGYGTVMRISYNNVNTNDVGDLFPQPDDWSVMSDGSIAVFSGREYRVRWIDTSGAKGEGPRIPFSWKHNDDDEKQRLVDSINTQRDKNYQERLQSMNKAKDAAEKARAVGKPVPAEAPPPGMRTPPPPPKVDLAEIPDYMPAYERTSSSLRADADGNLWIRPRPTGRVAGGPVYDIVNRKGELIDRVQLPTSRSLIGFGPGVVYLLARDAGATRIEQVQIR